MRKTDRLLERSAEIENPLIFSTDAEQENITPDGHQRKDNNNFLVMWLFITSVLLLLAGRVFYLQVVQGAHYQDVAEHNRLRSIVIKAPRGVIRDQKGETLARNIPSFDAVFVPADLPTESDQRKQIYPKLSQVLGMNELTVEMMMENLEHDAKERFLLKENIGEEAALILEENYSIFKGVYIEKSARRDYVDGAVFSPIIGYDGKITKEELLEHPEYLMTDYIGKNGIEYTYEKFLHGQHGEIRIEVDSNGQVKETLGVFNPLPGDELVLHIDAGLQRKTHEVLSRILEENKESTGAVAVAINPQNGGVLALVNVPSYDNNLFAKGISSEDYSRLINDERRPMTNRAVSGEYPPGSTFKPLVAAAALEEKVINEDTTVNCHGNISVGSWNFPDWSTHGVTDIKKAIAESCDVFFYSVGGGWDNIQGMGMDTMAKYANLFGLGEPVGVDLPAEGKGIIPTEEWKFRRFGEKWYVGDNYHCSIGQGFVTATPLQLANYIAAIANGGKLYEPRITKKIIHSADKTEETVQPTIRRQNFITSHNLEIVQQGMRQTVTDGSGQLLKDLAVATAGKTGTAQFGADEKLHSWYVSYGPFENPQMAMVVLVEGGGQGHDWAVPATKEIYKWYFEERNKQ